MWESKGATTQIPSFRRWPAPRRARLRLSPPRPPRPVRRSSWTSGSRRSPRPASRARWSASVRVSWRLSSPRRAGTHAASARACGGRLNAKPAQARARAARRDAARVRGLATGRRVHASAATGKELRGGLPPQRADELQCYFAPSRTATAAAAAAAAAAGAAGSSSGSSSGSRSSRSAAAAAAAVSPPRPRRSASRRRAPTSRIISSASAT